MNQKELKLLIDTCLVDSIFLTDAGDGFEVWAFGEEIPPYVDNVLKESARNRTRRTWSDLSRAYAFVKGLGWTGPITVESGISAGFGHPSAGEKGA